MSLPERPACFGQNGPIQCTCDRKRKGNECTQARYFWEAAYALATYRSDEQRKRYLAMLSRTHGEKVVKDLTLAARQLQRERQGQSGELFQVAQ